MNHGQFLKEVGAKIRNARKAKKITMEEMASMTGFTSRAIRSLEKAQANPHLLTVKTIADSLGVDVKEFL